MKSFYRPKRGCGRSVILIIIKVTELPKTGLVNLIGGGRIRGTIFMSILNFQAFRIKVRILQNLAKLKWWNPVIPPQVLHTSMQWLGCANTHRGASVRSTALPSSEFSQFKQRALPSCTQVAPTLDTRWTPGWSQCSRMWCTRRASMLCLWSQTSSRVCRRHPGSLRPFSWSTKWLMSSLRSPPTIGDSFWSATSIHGVSLPVLGASWSPW